MKTTSLKISDKLKTYSALAGVFMISAARSNAQTNVIEYTDVDPDQLHDISDPAYDLDINNDGYVDFSLSANKSTYYYVYSGYNIFFQVNSVNISPAEGNFVAGNYSSSTTSGFAEPSALNNGDLINSSLEWQSPSQQYLAAQAKIYLSSSFLGSYSIGDWKNGVTDKFLALKFNAGGSTYYGWLRMDVNEDNRSYVIKDYAYNTVEDEGLEAGQSELLDLPVLIDPSLINIYAFDKTIHINSKDLKTKNNTVQIFNGPGQSFYSGELELNGMQIDCSAFAPGLYIVHIEADGKVLNKKISIY